VAISRGRLGPDIFVAPFGPANPQRLEITVALQLLYGAGMMLDRLALRSRTARVLSAMLLTACGGDYDSAGSGGDVDDEGGGNVGFGGAQDIGAFRGILEDGGIPGERTLDPGGFFAEHYSESPPADCGRVLCLVGMTSLGRDWVGGADQALLQIGMTTPVNPAELERLPLNLVVVADVSGSMAVDDRIGYARQGLHLLVDQLQPGDRLALVTYSDWVTVWNELSEETSATQLHQLIDNLQAAGGTDIHAGLERGFQMSLENWEVERQNRVLLVSDGLATSGITDDGSILAMSDRYFHDGIGLTTVGVGLDFNIELMQSLAERGAGNFYFLESPSAIAEVFREEMEISLTPLAFEVELEVAAESGWRLGEAVGSRFWSGGAAQGGLLLPAVFVASRQSDQPGEYGRRGAGGALFVALEPTSGSIWDGRQRLAALRLRYRDPASGEHVEASLNVDAGPPATDSPAELRLSHESMAEHYAMYNVFLGLRTATRHAGRGDYNCALATLDSLDRSASRWIESTGDEDIIADRTLIARFQQNLRTAGTTSGTSATSCASPDAPYPDDYYGDGDYYCSAANGAGGPPLLVLLAALVLRRRRCAA
jgi:Ca-activated chloride channel family protein